MEMLVQCDPPSFSQAAPLGSVFSFIVAAGSCLCSSWSWCSSALGYFYYWSLFSKASKLLPKLAFLSSSLIVYKLILLPSINFICSAADNIFVSCWWYYWITPSPVYILLPSVANINDYLSTPILRTYTICSPLKICFINVFIALIFIRMPCNLSASGVLSVAHLTSTLFNQTYWRNEMRLIQEAYFPENLVDGNSLIHLTESSTGFFSFFCWSSAMCL